VTKDVAFIAGIGYQVDMQKPEETYAGESLGETGFDAITCNLGLVCKF